MVNSSKSRYNPFTNPPEVSGVNLNERIDVASFWMVRDFLKTTGPLLLRPIGNSIRINIFDDTQLTLHSDPYVNIGFFDEKVKIISTDEEYKIIITQVYYYDPNFLDKIAKIVKNWYQCVLNTGRHKEAIGTPDEFIHSKLEDQ